MYKVILFALLTTLSGQAMAEWIEIGGNGGTTLYADIASIRQEKNRATMWNMFDFKKARPLSNGELVLSAKGQVEYDCNGEQSRKLFVSYHSGNMGGGMTIKRESEVRQWEPVPPDSLNKTMWEAACGIKH